MGYFNRDDRSRGGGRSFDRGGRGGGGFRRGNFGGGDRGDRQMFDAICSNCGNACQVPFRPTGEKPVYCSDCFEKMGGGRRDERPHFAEASRGTARVDTQFKVQLDALNVKLDKIISLLEPKVEVVAKKEVVLEEKAPKVKKVVSKKK